MTQATAPPPAFFASAVERVCRVLADAVTGSEIPNLIAALKVPEPPGAEQNTKWKRLFNTVAERQNRQGDGRPLLRLVTEVMAPVRFESPARFNDIRARLNERLLLIGYQVTESGKLARARPAATLSEAQRRADDLRSELIRRDVHADVLSVLPRRTAPAELFPRRTGSVQKRRGQAAGPHWGELEMERRWSNATCSLGSGPRVAFNDLATEWERSEQTGIATLLKGLFSTFRNPAAHAPRVLWSTSRKDALDMLTLASMFHRRLDGATVREPMAKTTGS